MSNTFDQELPTPINCTIFSAYLEGYDKLEADYLLNGFSQGFQIFRDLIYTNTCCRNLPSAVERPDVVT